MQTISMTSIETQSFQLISHSRMFYLLAACENEFVKSARVTLLHNTAVVRKMRRRQSSFPPQCPLSSTKLNKEVQQ